MQSSMRLKKQPSTEQPHVCTCACKSCHDTGILVGDCKCVPYVTPMQQHIETCCAPCVCPAGDQYRNDPYYQRTGKLV